MEIEIRLAKISDLESIMDLSQKLFEFERGFGKTFKMDWSYSDDAKKFFISRIKGEGGITLIAEKDNKVIAYLCSHTATYSYRSINPIAEIENMFIDEKYRYKGLGKVLFKRLKEHLKKNGIKRMKVGALAQNDQAIKFYKRIGFKEFETVLEQNLK